MTDDIDTDAAEYAIQNLGKLLIAVSAREEEIIARCTVGIEAKLDEAADEIERLKKLVTTWIICAERLVESHDDAYEKAIDFYRDCQRIANETCK